MRILDEDNGRLIDSVLIMLTKEEAKELIDKTLSIDVDKGEHIHVNDHDYQRQITVFIYTPQNMIFFSEAIRKAVIEGEERSANNKKDG